MYILTLHKGLKYLILIKNGIVSLEFIISAENLNPTILLISS